jgi:hypothetical protein
MEETLQTKHQNSCVRGVKLFPRWKQNCMVFSMQSAVKSAVEQNETKAADVLYIVPYSD